MRLYLALFTNYYGIHSDETKVVACPFCGVSTTNGEVVFRQENMPDMYFWCMSCGVKAVSDGEYNNVSSKDVAKVYPQSSMSDMDARFVYIELGFVTKTIRITNNCQSWIDGKTTCDVKTLIRKNKVDLTNALSIDNFCRKTEKELKIKMRQLHELVIYVDSIDIGDAFNSDVAEDWLIVYTTTKCGKCTTNITSSNILWLK